VADSLGVSSETVQSWMYKARRLSLVVREHLLKQMLHEKQALWLSKYDEATQEALADVVIRYKLSQDETRRFLRLFDENRDGSLDGLVVRVRGKRMVTVEVDAFILHFFGVISRVFRVWFSGWYLSCAVSSSLRMSVPCSCCSPAGSQVSRCMVNSIGCPCRTNRLLVSSLSDHRDWVSFSSCLAPVRRFTL